MQTFNPNDIKPAFLKALEATQKVIEAREVTAKLAMLKDVEATMKPLTGRDDLRIKTARTSLLAYNKLLNEFLYQKGEYRGIEFAGFEDFESKLTTPDKEILIALLLDASYTKLPKRSAYCPECSELIEYDLVVADLFTNPETEIPEWDHPEPVYEKVFTQTMFDGVLTVGIKMPTESKRNIVYETMSLDTARKSLIEKGSVIDLTDALAIFIDFLEIKYMNEETGKEETYVLRDLVTEIRPYLDAAPVEVHREIENFINDTLSKYTIKLKAPITCSNCGHQFSQLVSPEAEFFREAFSI